MATFQEVMDYIEIRRFQCLQELEIARDLKNYEVVSNCERAIAEFDFILTIGKRKNNEKKSKKSHENS